VHERTYTRRLLASAVAGACAVTLLVWLWRSTDSAAAPARTSALAGSSQRLTPSTPSTSSAAGAAASSSRSKGPVVQAISVDKPSVCRGEENFVNVRATDADGGDANLRVSLLGTTAMGNRMPFRLYGTRGKALPRVLVQGTAGRELTADLPAVTIKDCAVEESAAIELIALGAATDDWRFVGRVTAGEFRAESYEWDFGDGTRVVSAEPEVIHSYRFRPQEKRYASFLITLTLRDARGELLHTSRAFGFSNPAFGRLVRGEVGVFSQRLAEKDGHEVIRLYHAYKAPVRLERVAVKVRSEDGRTEDAIGEYAAQDTIGLRSLSPGQPAEVTLALQSMRLPSTRPLRLVFEVTGSTSDGLPASGVFSAQVL
jgi:hypothetical protein